MVASSDQPDDDHPSFDMMRTVRDLQRGYNDITPVTVAILAVYFVQGVLGLSRLAVSFYFKDELHLSPADAGALLSFSSLPWLVKPLYGFLSDGFPLFGYRRRSYLFLSGLLGCMSWIAFGTIVHDTSSALVCVIASSASVAISDVVADSIVVEQSRVIIEESTATQQKGVMHALDYIEPVVRTAISSEQSTSNSADLQSLCWGSAAVGGILSAYFSGSLLQVVSPQQVFLITSIFPLLTACSALLIDEKPLSSGNNNGVSITDFMSSVSVQVSDLWTTISRKSLYLPVLFIFLWQATPSAESAMFYFTTNDLKFQPELLGQIRLASSVASLLGVIGYRSWLKAISIKDVIVWSTIISVPLGLTQTLLTSHYNRVLGIPDALFALIDTVVLTVLGQVAFMPVLALAASLCPPGIEGTLFAALMSVYNASGALSGELGAAVTATLGITDTNFEQLTTLIVICSMSSLLPLLFIDRLMGPSQQALHDRTD
jgi:Na+/melibiose symporter-like transporter